MGVKTVILTLIVVNLNVVIFVFGNNDNPQVKIKQGILRGAIKVTEEQKQFYAFTGIPYAKPPINDLRFKRSISAQPWNGILDATNPHPRCLQSYSYLKNYTVLGSEDCLYLNVYTPRANPEKKLAVMIFIHGGAFITGSAMDYDPSLLINHEIVLVTINYRLGPFGFLTTGSMHILGNDGLKDQVLAIKWVKENIGAFGGDPEKITLFGQGAGGISANLHMISPMSRNLISGVISQSGTALAMNALAPYFISTRLSSFLAERLGCPIYEEIDDMVDCLMTKRGNEIIETASGLIEWDIEPITVFKPVIEPDIPEAFMPLDPIDIILSGKAANVPFMTGFTTDEGDFRTRLLFKEPKLVQEFNENVKNHLPLVLNFKEIATPKYEKIATKEIRASYLKNKKLNEARKKGFSTLYTDAMYLVSTNYAADIHSKNSKQSVYYYVFGYKGSESYCNLVKGSPDDFGVCHSDDLLYLFNNEELFPNFIRNQSEDEMANLMTKLWTNFAKFGTPTPNAEPDSLMTWEPYSANKRKCYVIKDSTNVTLISNCYKERTNFWRSIDINERTITLRKDRQRKNKDEL